jgi:hypothetical protein
VSTTARVLKISLAHYLFDSQLVIGGGLRAVSLGITSDTASTETPIAQVEGGNFETGVLWKPNRQSIRIGGTLSLPVTVDQFAIDKDNCDPLDCAGYILPERIKAPWVASAGVAYRRAPTAWNTKVKSEWRDEKSLLVGFDVVVTGKTHRGFGLEAFGEHQLQPSGRKTSISLRGGVEYEWLPGTLRVRGGSYFEPGRFKDPEGKNIPGRVHLTVGLDWHFWSFSVWDFNYRAQISTWADGADKFGVSGLSIGFWH